MASRIYRAPAANAYGNVCVHVIGFTKDAGEEPRVVVRAMYAEPWTTKSGMPTNVTVFKPEELQGFQCGMDAT